MNHAARALSVVPAKRNMIAAPAALAYIPFPVSSRICVLLSWPRAGAKDAFWLGQGPNIG
eukprot:6148532-Alexandrium_andersonii.AAC.1